MFVNQLSQHRILDEQDIVQETFKIVVTVHQAMLAFPNTRAARQNSNAHRFAVRIQDYRKTFLFEFADSIVQ